MTRSIKKYYDKNSFGVAENGEVVEVLTSDNGTTFKQYEFNSLYKEEKKLAVWKDLGLDVKIITENKFYYFN